MHMLIHLILYNLIDASKWKKIEKNLNNQEKIADAQIKRSPYLIVWINMLTNGDCVKMRLQSMEHVYDSIWKDSNSQRLKVNSHLSY